MSTRYQLEAESAQPAWRRSPPRRRRKLRRSEAVIMRTANPAAGQSAEHRSDPRLRLHFAWRHLTVGLLLAVVIFGLLQLFTNYQFFVYTARIRGNQHVPWEAVYAASQVDEQSIFWIRPDEVAGRIAELSEIAAVQIHVRLPNQVIIDVRERIPLLVWQTAEATIWIAADGKVLPSAGEAPALTLVDPTGAAADESGSLRPKLLEDIQALYAVQPDLTYLHYGLQEGLYFRAPDGWTVYLGQEGNISDKLTALQIAQREIAASSWSPGVVDLRFEKHVYLR